MKITFFFFFFQHKPFDPRPVSHMGVGPDFTPDYVKPAVISNKVIYELIDFEGWLIKAL